MLDLRWESFYLQQRDEPALIDKLAADLEALERLLAAYPRSGRKLAERGSLVLRKLRLRRTPYYVWYSVDESDRASAVTLTRLFHAKQQTPQPRLPL